MKRTRVCIILILAVVSAALTGCPRPRGEGSRPQTRAVDGEITVRLLTDSTGIDDKSYNAAAWRGILEFYGDSWDGMTKRGTAYDIVTAETREMFAPNLTQATGEGYDLIVTAGFTWAAALAEVAGRNPQQKYLIVDTALVDAPNVMRALYADHEGSYLVGAAAALKAREDGIANPRFGFIGGIPGEVITKFEVGFVQGVLAISPDAEIVDYYVNSWMEPALVKNQAKNWFDSGVYAIYSAAGYSGNGAIVQAREYRTAGRNVWAIGVDSDQHEEGLYNATDSAVLISMIKRVEISMIHALEAVKENRFSGKVITFDLAGEGVGYSTSNPLLSNSIVIQLETLKQRIISGEITVASTYAQAMELSGFPQNLKATDD